jgi:hypothetical protein
MMRVPSWGGGFEGGILPRTPILVKVKKTPQITA